MKIKMIAALSIATAATALHLAAVARADSDEYEFASPTGNIACNMNMFEDGTGAAYCEIRDHTWAVSEATRGPFGRACDLNFGGLEFYLDKGKAPALGCYEGAGNMSRPGPALGYGQTHSVGTITCGSEPSGVTCTDSSTGHFFRVSRETYQFG
jgi:hypothetical protein